MNILPAYLSAKGAGSGLTAMISTFPTLALVFLVILQLIRGKLFHKVRLLRIGFALTPLAMAGMYLFRDNIPALFFIFLLTGIAYAAGFTNIFSMMYDVVPKEKHRSGSAIFGISGLMTSGVASIIAQAVYLRISTSAIFIIPGIFHLLALILTFFIPIKEIPMTEKRNISLSQLADRKMFPLFLLALLFGGAFGVFKSFLPIITEIRLGYVDITRFFSIFTIMGISYRFIFFKLIDRFNRNLLICGGFLSAGTAILFLGIINDFYQLYLIGGLYGLAHSLLFPTISTEYVRRGGDFRAAYNNVFLALFTAGVSLISSSLGFLGDWLGINFITIFMGTLMIISGLIIFINLLHSKNVSKKI